MARVTSSVICVGSINADVLLNYYICLVCLSYCLSVCLCVSLSVCLFIVRFYGHLA